jgi:general stress protein YciG
MAERSKRGFASMDPAKQRQIASKGGKAAHAKGTAHEFTREEAVEAGRKGGKAAHAKGTAHRFSSAEAGEAGRTGGEPAGGEQEPRTTAAAQMRATSPGGLQEPHGGQHRPAEHTESGGPIWQEELRNPQVL